MLNQIPLADPTVGRGGVTLIEEKDFRLPQIEELPNLALMILGKALTESYRDTIEQPLPEPLARLVQQIGKGETSFR